MTSVLIYSKKHDEMVKIMVEQLGQLGFKTEQSSTINLPRIILNPYQVIHFVVSSLPLTLNEVICMASAKALGKAVVLSLLDAPTPESNLQKLPLANPDGLTVSQTNYLKLFRNKTSNKMIIPTLFENLNKHPNTPITPVGFLFPLHENLAESIHFKAEKPVYFDGRKLLKKYSSSALRKKWTALILQNKIKPHYHLILSDDKIESLLSEKCLTLVLASAKTRNSDFTHWLKLALKYRHLLVLNQYQATGFSNHWTSGHNCIVTTAADWVSELNEKIVNAVFENEFMSDQLEKKSLDSIFNDLSRLYLKIIYQKTSLIESDTAKI